MALEYLESLRKSTVDKAKGILSNADPEDDVEEEQQQIDYLEELSEYCPKLTFQQRLIGFASSFSIGCTCVGQRVVFPCLSITHHSHLSYISRFNCLLFLSLFYTLDGRKSIALCLELYLWSCTPTHGLDVSVWTQATVQVSQVCLQSLCRLDDSLLLLLLWIETCLTTSVDSPVLFTCLVW